MIRDLNRGLSPGTEPAAADGVRGLVLELFSGLDHDHAGLPVSNGLEVRVHHANAHPAAGAAQGTDARLPDGDARQQVIVRHEANELMLGVAAGGERGARAGDSGQLDEVPAVHRRFKSDT